MRDDKAAFHHWAKGAAEIARVASLVRMAIDVARTIVAEEERGGA